MVDGNLISMTLIGVLSLEHGMTQSKDGMPIMPLDQIDGVLI